MDFDRTNLVPFSLDIGSTERLDVNGGGGADTITGSAGLAGLIRLRLDGGADNDRITGGDGADVLLGGDGNDVLTGFRGADSVFGGYGSDRMIWNNGDGSDVMEGGAGYDIVQVNGAVVGDAFTIAANGARVDFDRTNLVPFSLDIGSTERLDVNGGGGADTITGSAGLAGLIRLRLDGGADNDRITGGDGADVLLGGEGNDVLLGDRGADRVYGGNGNDRMIWNNGDGSDVMEGGAGYDTVQVNGAAVGDAFTIGANGPRVDFDRTNIVTFSLDIGSTERLDVNGGGGADTITGSAGLAGLIRLRLDGGADNDRITGGDGADVLLGGEGNDVLLGDRGADRVYGGNGNDRMIWNNGDGSDVMEGGAGYDIVQVNGAVVGDAFTIAANGARVDFDRTNLVPFSLDIGSTERLDVNGGGGADTITGSAGLAGLIRLRLDGGADNDRITGGDGADVIVGGDGNDVLTGRSDADVFVFDDGTDRITDFDDGVDTIRIVVNGIDSFADLTGLMSDVGPNAMIDFGNGDRLGLQGVSIVDLDAGDFVFG
ncbi:calcium-binding protein [Paracoccus sp. MC1854]|nr:calcium-binding protein [Paracoccus sp. MC1854]